MAPSLSPIVPRAPRRFREHPLAPRSSLLLRRDLAGFRLPGRAAVDLSTRAVFRRLLVELVNHHAQGSREPLSASALMQSGWPNERMLRASARNRLNNALATLRSLGLRGILRTERTGYRLDPACSVALVDDLDDADAGD